MNADSRNPSGETGDPVQPDPVRDDEPVAADVIEPVANRPAREAADKPRLRFRVVPITLAIVFSVLALVVWYIVTARAVTLIVEPEPEDMDLDGGLFAVELGGRYLLRPGEYRISADKEGYYPFEETFEVSTESGQEYAFALRKLPGL